MGVNHNGQRLLAEKLIEKAAWTGADAVKFQTWKTEELVVANAPQAHYQKKQAPSENQFQMLAALELTEADFSHLQRVSATYDITFLSTPDEERSADFLEKLGVQLFKIGSGEVTNLPFLRHIARKQRPIILSTGMSSLGEVETAVRTFEAEGNQQLILLHCVSDYPAKASDCNLRAMSTLRSAFGYPVGFSDHTLGSEVAAAAVALGACVIEKHLTLDPQMEGPDHAASANPDQFAALVNTIRAVESALGNGIKSPTAAELQTKKVVQKRLLISTDLPAGHLLEARNFVRMRAADGLEPKWIPMLEGRSLRRALSKHSPIDWTDLS